jgi:hypothetical protein
MTDLLARQKEFTGYLVVGFPEFALKGLPIKSACAVTGNATQENNVEPVTKGALDHGSDGALQWRLSRLDGPTGLRGWAGAHGIPWDTLRTQAAFFLYECARDYQGLIFDLQQGSKSLETLTANVMAIYERPAKQYAALDARIAAARKTYAAMASAQPAPTPPPVPAPIRPILASPYTSNIGWLVICYGLACYFRITIFGYPAEGDAVLSVLLGLYMLYSPDAKPEKAVASEPKDDNMSTQLEAFKVVVTDLIGVVDAVIASHTALKTQTADAASVDQEIAALTEQFKATVDKLRALTQ